MPTLSQSLTCMRSFDLFGIKPSVYFRGKLKSGTTFGFCLSVLLLTFTSVCFGYFGQDLYYHQNPILRFHKSYTPKPEKITLDPSQMPIMIELNSPYGDIYYTDRNTVAMYVSQLTIQKTNDETSVIYENYPMEICTKDHFSKLETETQAYFLNKNLSDFFCIPLFLKNLTMQGAFDQDLFQTIKFTASICSNDTANITCLPLEEIQRNMAYGFIGVYFYDYTIDPNDYKKPINTQPKEVFTNFVLNSQKQIDIFLENNYIHTEDGVIFPSNHVEKITNFDDSQEFNLMTENSDFFMIYFKIKQENSYYERSYRKLQDLLAQIGGFINCFWIIAIMVNYFYSNLFIISEVILNIFTIKIFLAKRKKARKEADVTFSILLKKEEMEPIPIELGSEKNGESLHAEEGPEKRFASLHLIGNIVDEIDEGKNDATKNDEKKEEKTEEDKTEDDKIDEEKNEEEKNDATKNGQRKKEEKKNVHIKWEMSPKIKKREILNEFLGNSSPTELRKKGEKSPISLENIQMSKIQDKQELDSAFSTRKLHEIQKLMKIDEDLKNFQVISDLNLGFLDYLHYYTGCFKTPERERKKIIIIKGSNIVKNCLDIKNIIQKFYEIEKLKQILLCDEDLDKFIKLPKPELKIIEEEDDANGRKGKKKHSIVTNVCHKRISFDASYYERKNMGVKIGKSMKKSKFSDV